MVRTTVFCFFAYSIIAIFVFNVECHALVISAPTLDGNGIATYNENANVDTKRKCLDLDLRIRSTNEADIQEIASMLTSALMEEDGAGPSNAIKKKHQFLSPLNYNFRKIRSGVAPLLQSRMNAIKIGSDIMHQNSGKLELKDFTEADQLRLLWSNDAFRNSVEKAASLSNEPHIWKEHNFVCAPQSFDWLFHKMITAENAISGEIVGFCEIAMLSPPVARDSSESSTFLKDSIVLDEECSLIDIDGGVPTILNLVTSKEYRRRGVGSTVMNAAMNYVKYSSLTRNEMALYVDSANDSAINMYEKLGFQKTRRVESKKQWYMIRQFPSLGCEAKPLAEVKAFR